MTQLVSWVRSYGMERNYVGSMQISLSARLAVISSEDQLFPDHSGFDWKSIKKAMKYNEKKPGRTHGASTISQQVAKNVFLWQGRDWVRKGLEAYFTVLIEFIWGKKRIMEVYLNSIEMGEGVYGVEAASQHCARRSRIADRWRHHCGWTESARAAATSRPPLDRRRTPCGTHPSSTRRSGARSWAALLRRERAVDRAARHGAA